MTDEFITDLEDKINRMREIRERANWTQQQVADHLGVDRSRVIRWEKKPGDPGRENPGFEYLVKLDRLLNNLQMEYFKEQPPDES